MQLLSSETLQSRGEQGDSVHPFVGRERKDDFKSDWNGR